MNHLKIFIAIVATFSIASSCKEKPEHNTLSDSEKKEGWQLLFDGTSLKGWHIYNKGNVAAAWVAKDGTLWCNTATKSQNRADLTTDKQHQNFELSFEWKVAKGGNSGVIFDVQEQPKYAATFLTGPEYQVLDDDNSAVHKGNPFQIAGSLYNVVKTNGAVKPKPYNDWNQSVVKQENGKITFWLNGTMTLTADMNSPAWKQDIQNSNMRFYPDFGKFMKGKICLQDHNDQVWYRDLKIKEL